MNVIPTAAELIYLHERRVKRKNDILDGITLQHERVLAHETELAEAKRKLVDLERELSDLDKLLEAHSA